jgi:hypothetical protein
MSPFSSPAQPDGPTPFEPIVAADRDPLPGRKAGRRGAPIGNHADRARVTAARWLALVLGLLVLAGTVPAMNHLNLAAAPGWARVILLVAALQLAYLAWMAILPDRSTLWVAMLVFAVVATLCALGMAVGLATPADRPLPLGLDAVREKIARWCAAALLLNTLATWLCGRMSVRWRRAVQRPSPASRQTLS